MTTEIKEHGNKKLLPEHRLFLKHQLSRLEISPLDLRDRLNDPKFAEEHEFPLIKVCYQTVQRFIKSIPKMEMAQMQAVYLTDFSDTPLAWKKIRIQELIKIYLSIENMTRETPKGKLVNLTERGKATFKMNVLKQLKDEVGEDVETMAEAMRGISVSHQHNIFNLDGTGNGTERQQLNRNLASIFGPTGNGSGNGDGANPSRL